MSRQHKSTRSNLDRRTFLAAAAGAAFVTGAGKVGLGADAAKLPDTLSIYVPACWTSNLKLAVKAIVASPGNETIRKEVREVPAARIRRGSVVSSRRTTTDNSAGRADGQARRLPVDDDRRPAGNLRR